MRNWAIYDIPKRYIEKEFEIFPDKEEAIKHLEQFLKTPKGPWCLYIYGVPGCGKTHLVCHLLKKFLCLSEFHSARFLTHRSYYQKLQDCFNDNLASHELNLKHRETDLLIFDDLGTIADVDWKVEKVNDLIYDRYDDGRKTIITSNKSLHEYKKDTRNDRVYRRLAEGLEIEWSRSEYLKTNRIDLE